MKAVMKRAAARPRSPAKSLHPDVIRWTRRRAGFSLFAGRCTPADIQSLERVRARRLYRQVSPNWRDFCMLELGAHRRNVERVLGYLREFGPQYFRVTRLAHVPAADYRLIAHHVEENGVHLDGSIIPLIPDKRRQVADAIQELLRRIPNRRPERATVPAARMLKRLGFAAEALANLDRPLDALDKMDLAELVIRIRRLAIAQGLAG
jgi:hypothetical protein